MWLVDHQYILWCDTGSYTGIYGVWNVTCIAGIFIAASKPYNLAAPLTYLLVTFNPAGSGTSVHDGKTAYIKFA